MKQLNWEKAYNILFNIINQKGEMYLGGSAFINIIKEIKWDMPNYTVYIEERRKKEQSTSRCDYYKDILDELSESERFQAYSKFLEFLKSVDEKNERVNILNSLICGNDNYVRVEQPEIIEEVWNSKKLKDYLDKIDQEINTKNYNYSVTLCYTCLEGFYKAFIQKKIPEKIEMNDLNPMAKEVKNYLQNNFVNEKIEYSEQLLNLITTITNAISNSRNKFSDSHFDNEAEKWMAEFSRDCVNSIARLILHFINN